MHYAHLSLSLSFSLICFLLEFHDCFGFYMQALFYKKYSTSSDVWSYGMLMYEIWSLGHKPFSHMGQAKVS